MPWSTVWTATATTSPCRSSRPNPARAPVRPSIRRTRPTPAGTSAPMRTASPSDTTTRPANGPTAGRRRTRTVARPARPLPTTAPPPPTVPRTTARRRPPPRFPRLRLIRNPPRMRAGESTMLGPTTPAPGERPAVVRASGVPASARGHREPEPRVAQRGVGARGGAGRRAVATAVGRVAHVGPAAQHRLRVRVAEGADGPLPHVAGRVVEAVPVGRVRIGGHGADAAGGLVREPAREGVHAHLAVGLAPAAPRVGLLVEAAAGRVLPLCLRGQAGAHPCCVGERIALGHVRDRVGGTVCHRARGAGRLASGTRPGLGV